MAVEQQDDEPTGGDGSGQRVTQPAMPERVTVGDSIAEADDIEIGSNGERGSGKPQVPGYLGTVEQGGRRGRRNQVGWCGSHESGGGTRDPHHHGSTSRFRRLASARSSR